MDAKSALLYSRLNQHVHLVKKARGFIRWALERVSSPYVACSFGKDSSVLLHLVLQQMPGIPVLWVTFQETRMIDNYDEIVSAWSGINLHEITVDVDAESEYQDQRAMIEFARENGFDSAFVGIRKDESVGRRKSLDRHGMFFKAKNGLARICPLADWKTEDVAAYCAANELPMLSTYKEYGFESRTVTGVSDDSYSFRINQLNRIKRTDISRFNRILSEYPELKKYT